MRKVLTCALLLVAALLSPAAAQDFGGNYLYTPQQGAASQIDVQHTSTWNIEVNCTTNFSGAKLTMKRGPKTEANITFALYSGKNDTGELLCRVELAPASVSSTDFDLVTFECPGPPLNLSVGSYYATLTSPSPNPQSTAYLLKGYPNSIIASSPGVQAPCFGPPSTSSGLNLLKVAPKTALVNSTQTYTIYIGNSGPANVSAGSPISFIDQLPDGVAAVAKCVGNGLNAVSCEPYGEEGAQLTCNATLAETLVGAGNGTQPAEGPFMTCTVTMPASPGSITNWASIDPTGGTAYPPPVGCTRPPCAQATTDVVEDPVEEPSMLLTKTSPNPVEGGKSFDYTINMGNNGTVSTDGDILIADRLPPDFVYVGATAGDGVSDVYCVDYNGFVTCTVTLEEPLEAGTDPKDGPSIILTVTPPNKDITATNYASTAKDGTSIPPQPGPKCKEPGCAFAVTSVEDPVEEPSMLLTKASPNPVEGGKNFDYTINMGNNGTASVEGPIVIADQLPPDFVYVGATAGDGVSDVKCVDSSGLVTCTVTLKSPLAAGTDPQAGPSVTLEVRAPKVAITATNYASTAKNGISTPPQPGPDCKEPGCAFAVTTVTDPDLQLVKLGPATAPAGSNVVYTIELGNAGTEPLLPNAAVPVPVLDQLPPGSRFVSASPGSGVDTVQCDPSPTGLVSCSLVLSRNLTGGTAPANGAKFTLTATAPLVTGSVTNYASVARDGVTSPAPTPGPGCTTPNCGNATLTVTEPSLLEKKMMLADTVKATVDQVKDEIKAKADEVVDAKMAVMGSVAGDQMED